MDCCLLPALIGVGICLTGYKNVSTPKNKVGPYDDERPRKMTPYELEMYRLHMNAYGTTK